MDFIFYQCKLDNLDHPHVEEAGFLNCNILVDIGHNFALHIHHYNDRQHYYHSILSQYHYIHMLESKSTCGKRIIHEIIYTYVLFVAKNTCTIGKISKTFCTFITYCSIISIITMTLSCCSITNMCSIFITCTS